MADEEQVSKSDGAGEEVPDQEDEVDLLCTQLLRRLNQLKTRKAADIALKAICDATISELRAKSREVKARCYKRQQASATYTETIAETEVASAKVVATADAVKTVLNADVEQDDPDDVPWAPEEEMVRRDSVLNKDSDDGPRRNSTGKKKKKRKSGGGGGGRRWAVVIDDIIT